MATGQIRDDHMFPLRGALAIGAIVMILPAAGDPDRTEGIEVVRTISASRTLAGDIGAICDRKPVACQTARASAAVVAAKMETAVSIAAAGLRQWRSAGDPHAVASGSASDRENGMAAAASPRATGSLPEYRRSAPEWAAKTSSHAVPLPRPRPTASPSAS